MSITRAADLGVELPKLPIDRSYDPVYGVVVQVAPGVRRVLAHNPNAFTFHGTGTYIVGTGTLAVIDPGPLQTEHVEALLAATKGERISHILITHTHNDHSPAALPLKQATGAKTYGFGRHGGSRTNEGVDVEEGGDQAFEPDVVVRDGDLIEGDGFVFEALHTPGHTSNHICYGLKEAGAFFSGDHVMGWSTTVIAPPDGNMAQYFQSLQKLLVRKDNVYYPTHGNPVREPQQFVLQLIAHRHAREEQIEVCVRHGLSSITEMVGVIYSEIDKRMHPAAARSVLAHLQHMVERGRVGCEGAPTAGARYRPV